MPSSELGHRVGGGGILAPARSRLRGATGRLGGAQGNERLTSAVALALLVLLGAEVLTTLALSSFLPVHLFLGLALLPAVSLKLASVTLRMAGYYAGSAEYRRRGPPQIGLRLLGPALVAATVVLFGSGVALVVTGRGGGVLGTLHVGSFVVWSVFIVAHVGVHLLPALDGGLADWRPRRRLPGAGWRATLVLGALVAGIALALATHPVQSSWLSDHHHHHDDAGAQAFERR